MWLGFPTVCSVTSVMFLFWVYKETTLSHTFQCECTSCTCTCTLPVKCFIQEYAIWSTLTVCALPQTARTNVFCTIFLDKHLLTIIAQQKRAFAPNFPEIWRLLLLRPLNPCVVGHAAPVMLKNRLSPSCADKKDGRCRTALCSGLWSLTLHFQYRWREVQNLLQEHGVCRCFRCRLELFFL